MTDLAGVVDAALADQRQLLLDLGIAAAELGDAGVAVGHQPPEATVRSKAAVSSLVAGNGFDA